MCLHRWSGAVLLCHAPGAHHPTAGARHAMLFGARQIHKAQQRGCGAIHHVAIHVMLHVSAHVQLENTVRTAAVLVECVGHPYLHCKGRPWAAWSGSWSKLRFKTVQYKRTCTPTPDLKQELEGAIKLRSKYKYLTLHPKQLYVVV